VVVAVLTAAVLVGVLWNVGAWKKPTFDLSVWRRSVHFAWPAYGGNVAGYLTYRINEFIIAVFLPPEQLAYYVLAVGIVERLWVLPGAAAVALLPHLTNSPTRDPVLSAVIARHVALWVGGASLLLFAFAHPAVELLYSSAFSPAVAPLRWLLPGIFLLSIGKVVLAEVIAREKPHFPSLASAVALIVNVAVNVALTPSMGISGAAVAASASYALLAVMWVWYYTKETRVPWTALLPSPKDFLLYTELLRRASVLGALGARSRE
jgi:O-antigen/teichoic acid export membrane protein